MTRAPRPEAAGRARLPRGEAGFTLIEVAVALVLLTIGLVGAAAALSAQANAGFSGAASVGLGAISRSSAVSTATMLAQQKIEQLKANYGVAPTASTTCAGTVSGAVCTETAVAGYPQFSRTSTFATTGLPADSVAVKVEVTYKAAGDRGATLGGQVLLATVIARHP
jgi:prepilin-type N-terminal cleavage/methylation domain-containing protein